MDIVFDYRAIDPGNAANWPLPPGAMRELQPCYQEALGHELPNRLVAIQGLARLLILEQAERLDEEGRSHLDRLVQAARQADEMVRALADLGRLLRDPGPAIALDLGELAREALAEVKVLYHRRSIDSHLAEHLPAVTMPLQPWLQVFSLLCRYLVESTPADRQCRIGIAGETLGETVEVQVSDATTRAASELQPLFEPFAASGLAFMKGLGLFPLRMIVAGWNGRLQVQSTHGEGTRFTLIVHRATEAHS